MTRPCRDVPTAVVAGRDFLPSILVSACRDPDGRVPETPIPTPLRPRLPAKQGAAFLTLRALGAISPHTAGRFPPTLPTAATIAIRTPPFPHPPAKRFVPRGFSHRRCDAKSLIYYLFGVPTGKALTIFGGIGYAPNYDATLL